MPSAQVAGTHVSHLCARLLQTRERRPEILVGRRDSPLLILGKISMGMRNVEKTPSSRIRSASTPNVYGRCKAILAIHMARTPPSLSVVALWTDRHAIDGKCADDCSSLRIAFQLKRDPLRHGSFPRPHRHTARGERRVQSSPGKVYTAARGRGAASRKRLSYQLPCPSTVEGRPGGCCRPSMPTRYLARIPTWSGGSGAPKVFRILLISLVHSSSVWEVAATPSLAGDRSGIDQWPGPHRQPVGRLCGSWAARR
jgi:hypothetical protein